MAAEKTRRVVQRQSLFARLTYLVRLLSLKTLVRAFVLFRTHLHRPAPSRRPTHTKSYPIRPSITNRIFVPPSHNAGSPNPPLFIDIHGGGFAVGSPILDDADNLILSQKHGFLVVSLGYSLAPFNPYPTAVHDVAALIEAVLADETLHFDSARVVVGGYSAGANLALAAAQMNGLTSRIGAVVAYYAPTDFTRTGPMKLETATPPPGGKDLLTNMSAMFYWGYVSPGTDLEDPLLSPLFAPRDKLPSVYLIGCQYDMLCNEAEDMAEALAKSEESDRRVLKDPEGEGWEQGRVKWRKIHGVEHGFNQLQMVRSGLRETYRRKTDDMHDSVALWLKNEVFA